MAEEPKVAVGGETGAPTVEQLQALALKNGWYEGVPVPVGGLAVQLEDRYPMLAHMERLLDRRNVDRECSTEDVDETAFIRNSWPSDRLHGQRIYMVERRGKVHAVVEPFNTAAGMLMGTLGAAAGWSLEAEEKALGKLRELVKPHVYEQYFLTGTFLETSKRSGVTYMFRRLRPTLAIRPTADGKGSKILCALCLHPLGLYMGTWAGTMVPTDDVLAHLILMRGDERRLWRQANQHEPHTREAGIF